MEVMTSSSPSCLIDRLVISFDLPATTDHQAILDLLDFLRYLEMRYTRRPAPSEQSALCQSICQSIVRGETLKQHQLEWISYEAKKADLSRIRFLLRRRIRRIQKQNRRTKKVS